LSKFDWASSAESLLEASYYILSIMGRSQTKKKTQAWRHNPIRVPDAHVGAGKAEGKADPGKEKQMLPILKKVCPAALELGDGV
jgi:hypothetical protein